METPNGRFQLIRGPRLPSVRWEKAPKQEQRGGRWRRSVETGSSTAVSTKDSHHKGATPSEWECTSVSPRSKVEDIRVEAFPRSGFQSRRRQRQSFEIGTGSGTNGRQRGSRSGWPSSSTRESQRVREGSASGQTDQGWRAVLDQSESSFGRARERAEYRRGQHRRCRAETRKVEGPGRSSPTSGTDAATTGCSSVVRHGGRDQAFAAKGGRVGGDKRHRSVHACANAFPGLQEVDSSQ